MVAMFSADTTIVPKESAIFSDYNLGSTTLLPYQQTDLYTKDYIGLQVLDKANKVYIRNCPGDHIDINDAEIEQWFIPFLYKASYTP